MRTSWLSIEIRAISDTRHKSFPSNGNTLTADGLTCCSASNMFAAWNVKYNVDLCSHEIDTLFELNM